jgi:hypothetical protein
MAYFLTEWIFRNDFLVCLPNFRAMSENKPITFHYIKDTNFRTALSTGAIGGLTIQRLINLNFYSDRPPIPKSITFDLKNSQELGAETDRDTKEGFIRDVHFGVTMDIVNAKELIRFLSKLVKDAESI